VRAICEQVAARAEQAAAEFGAATADGFRALAAREDIDAVLMLAPQWYGPLPILAACEMGKAVYCAAAMDLSLAQAETVKQRVEQSGIAFMAEFPRRLAPASLRLKELIATRLGQPRLLFCHMRQPYVPRNGKPLGLFTSTMTRQLMELVDWCNYVVGTPPQSVVGICHLGREGNSDYRMMSLEFAVADPAQPIPMAQISCGHYVAANWPEAITFRPPAALQVRCDKGIAFVDLPATLVWFDEAGRHMESLDSERPVGEQLLIQFHRSVTSLIRKTSDLQDAYLALQILLAADESAMHGKRIPIAFER
jgi:predicted dehydrogenase